MSHLARLDACLSETARVVFESVPLPEWQRAVMTVKYAPTGLAAFEFLYVTSDGATHEDQSPDGQHMAKLWGLARDHQQITSASGQPPWFAMVLTVERSGRFGADFEHRERYQEGDITRQA